MLGKKPWTAQLARTWRGIHSVAAGLAFPLGGWWLGSPRRWFDRDRLPGGLAIVLPGVEGWGPLNWSVARGLTHGGFPGAVMVHDWTTRLWPLFAYHLRWFPLAGGSGEPVTYVLPILALAALSTGYVALLTRSELKETMHAPFVKAARGRGLSSWRVVGVHALRQGTRLRTG